MALTALFFYLFAALAVFSAVMVIVARNPVHAVLFLILTFFNAAGLFVLLGAEFLAMLLIIVYVGAVAVLFLFVVMMLDVDFAELRAGFIKNAPLGALIGGILVVELIMVLGFQVMKPGIAAAPSVAIVPGASNTAALGRVLYTKYVYFFQGAGLILLVAMIGAIVLTLRHKEGVKRQSVSAQNARVPATAMEVVKVPSGGSVIPDKKPARIPEPAE
jgi:NADH-quinone oxidoreductase subunit J